MACTAGSYSIVHSGRHSLLCCLRWAAQLCFFGSKLQFDGTSSASLTFAAHSIVAVIRAGRGSALFGVGFKLAPGLPYILAAICDIELSVMMLFGLWRAKR